jgi:hypothetical protein
MAVEGRSKGETESEIIPTQHQALQTKYYGTKILQTETNSKSRLCKQFDEYAELHMQGKRVKIRQQTLI